MESGTSFPSMLWTWTFSTVPPRSTADASPLKLSGTRHPPGKQVEKRRGCCGAAVSICRVAPASSCSPKGRTRLPRKSAVGLPLQLDCQHALAVLLHLLLRDGADRLGRGLAGEAPGLIGFLERGSSARQLRRRFLSRSGHGERHQGGRGCGDMDLGYSHERLPFSFLLISCCPGEGVEGRSRSFRAGEADLHHCYHLTRKPTVPLTVPLSPKSSMLVFAVASP